MFPLRSVRKYFPNVKSFTYKQQICHYYQTMQNEFSNEVVKSKLRLIESEYNLLRHIDSSNVPSLLHRQDIEYLLSLFKSRKEGKMLWVDVSCRLRQKAFGNLCLLENFNGDGHLVMPFVGCEVIFFYL